MGARVRGGESLLVLILWLSCALAFPLPFDKLRASALRASGKLAYGSRLFARVLRLLDLRHLLLALLASQGLSPDLPSRAPLKIIYAGALRYAARWPSAEWNASFDWLTQGLRPGLQISRRFAARNLRFAQKTKILRLGLPKLEKTLGGPPSLRMTACSL